MSKQGQRFPAERNLVRTVGILPLQESTPQQIQLDQLEFDLLTQVT